MRLLPNDRNLGWTPYAWLIYLVPFILTPTFDETAGVATMVVALAVFLPLYFLGYWSQGPRMLAIIAAIVLIGVICWPANYGAGTFFIFAGAFAGYLDRPKLPMRVIGLIVVVILIEAWAGQIPGYQAAWPAVFTLLVGAINIHGAQVARSNARLSLAHSEVAHLAKLAERERIARDLHDLLGHTLSVVILKAELASKLADRDVERARTEIRDVERIAREALTQVRQAVGGYRSSGLAAEIEASRDALSSASIELSSSLPATALPPGQEAVLALAIREAVTNVIRHSGARRCTIAVASSTDMVTLVVHDDGRGGTRPFGNGLAGMRERVDALGGSLVRDGSSGTTLTIKLPVNQAALQVSA